MLQLVWYQRKQVSRPLLERANILLWVETSHVTFTVAGRLWILIVSTYFSHCGAVTTLLAYSGHLSYNGNILKNDQGCPNSSTVSYSAVIGKEAAPGGSSLLLRSVHYRRGLLILPAVPAARMLCILTDVPQPAQEPAADLSGIPVYLVPLTPCQMATSSGTLATPSTRGNNQNCLDPDFIMYEP